MIPALVLGYLRSNWRNLIVVGAVAAALLFAFVKGRETEAKANDARRIVAEQGALKSNLKANEKATAEQVRAAEQRADAEGKLVDAVVKVPDGTPDAVAVELGCARLLAAKVPGAANLPQCLTAR